MSKQITEKAQQGQSFFGLPADRTAPVTSVTVNGVSKPFTSNPNGINLNAPVNQNDVIVVTFDQKW
ncbi:hypothetical protein WS85_12880 [Burkholderia anthina]|uniref:hypothetical protein n=1 Tax=Burkholderia anthina TaxID=179879 RepID=UPI00075F0F2B|nr:hypothetical protein [Burkholderia anthina]KVH12226.1 hypothetical protein WS85_12880 [Burkholderia anthina]KVX39306.1 hypothetical protein WT32_06795 [Burkholderia anthina]